MFAHVTHNEVNLLAVLALVAFSIGVGVGLTVAWQRLSAWRKK